MASSLAILIDLRRCVGCTSCQVSCKMENAVPVGGFRSRVAFADVGEFPAAKRHFLPLFCNHCDNPPCVYACPVKGATTKQADGTVVVDRDLCIGCGLCVTACPYGARYLQPYIPIKNDPKPYLKDVPRLKGVPVKNLRVVDKCDFCADRRAAGEQETACQRNCFGKAIFFGDLNDPQSAIAKLLATEKTQVLKPEYGTQPRVRYIAPDTQTLDMAFERMHQP